MLAKLEDVDMDDYIKFLQSSPKGHFMQSPKWAKVKDNWTNEVILSLDGGGKIRGSMSLLIRKIPFFNSTMMYCPRGPVCDIHDRETISELLDGAKEIAKKYNSYVLKIDPDVEKDDLEFAKMIAELGFRRKSESKNFESIQPRFVFRLDVSGKTKDEVIAHFHSKTRYNIRVAIKNGVKVEVKGREALSDFHSIMLETGLRDGFVIRSLEYFEKMYDCLAPENLRLYMAYYEGKPIAGAIAVLYGNKVWYLYGASSNAHRNTMPNYLLQWEMIKWAIEAGCDIYDFRGVSGDLSEDNPLYGLYRFKKGFNGKLTEFIGELDYVFKPFIYFVAEHGENYFRNIRRKLFILGGGKLKSRDDGKV